MEALKMIKNNEMLSWDYDSEADVLYLTFGNPQIAEGIDINEGTIVRVNTNTGEICGITIIHPLKRTISSFSKKSFIKDAGGKRSGNLKHRVS